MRMRQLGNSGHEVSTLALGTMTWGRDTDEPESRSLYKAFIEAGSWATLDTKYHPLL